MGPRSGKASVRVAFVRLPCCLLFFSPGSVWIQELVVKLFGYLEDEEWEHFCFSPCFLPWKVSRWPLLPLPCACFSLKSGLWQQEDVSVTEISIAATLIALGQSLMQPSPFQTNLTLLIPRLIIFKNWVAFLNESHVTELLLRLLGTNLVFYFRFYHLHRRQEDAESEAVCGGFVSLWHQSVFIWWEYVFT